MKEVPTSRGRRRLGVDEVGSSEVDGSWEFVEARFLPGFTQNRRLPALSRLDGPRGDLNPRLRGIHVPKDEELVIAGDVCEGFFYWLSHSLTSPKPCGLSGLSNRYRSVGIQPNIFVAVYLRFKAALQAWLDSPSCSPYS